MRGDGPAKVAVGTVLLDGAERRGAVIRAEAADECLQDVVAEGVRHQLAEGALRPLVSKTYTLDEAVQALEDIAARRATGKLVVTP